MLERNFSTPYVLECDETIVSLWCP